MFNKYIFRNTKIGYKYTLLGLGLWIIPDEKRISVFCDKNSPFLNLIPREFWTQFINASVAQRSIFYSNRAYIIRNFYHNGVYIIRNKINTWKINLLKKKRK